MYDQIREDTLYMMFYGGVTVIAMIASCYLLFRDGNAFAAGITPPALLRRWTAAFFASIALCHLWYLPLYFLSSPDDVMLGNLIAGLLDSMIIIPLTITVLLTMLQDHHRPLWSVAAMVAPIVAGMVWSVASRSEDLLPVLFSYFLLMCLGFIIYMVRAIRQYRRWLRDNYADLEHKEVWQNCVALAIFLLVYVVYSLDAGELLYEYAMEGILVVLVCYLLWRVETLSALTAPRSSQANLPAKNIGTLLEQFCEESQLYLQYDMSLSQLAQTIGTNRLYLSQHFSSQGTTYNAYINGLRIQHFIKLYHEAVAAIQLISVRQLAHQSGCVICDFRMVRAVSES